MQTKALAKINGDVITEINLVRTRNGGCKLDKERRETLMEFLQYTLDRMADGMTEKNLRFWARTLDIPSEEYNTVLAYAMRHQSNVCLARVKRKYQRLKAGQ